MMRISLETSLTPKGLRLLALNALAVSLGLETSLTPKGLRPFRSSWWSGAHV